jgi:hypothetical protein
VEQHGDVARLDAELARDVLARSVLEHAQRDDGALDVGEPGHAAREAPAFPSVIAQP